MDGIPMEGGIIMEMSGMPNIASMILQGGPPIMSMNNPNIYEEDIQEKKIDITEEKDNYSETGSEHGSISEISESGSERSESGSERSGSERSGSERSGSESEGEYSDSEDEIEAKGKVEEIKEDKDIKKIVVDRKSSIKELKNICQIMKLSTSGNKADLINRINKNK